MNVIAHNWVLRLVIVVFLAYGSYTAWLAVQHKSAWFLFWAIPSVVGGIGLAFSRPWSRYLVYMVALCTVAGWAGFVALYWSSIGADVRTKLFVLGAGLTVVSVGSSLLVFHHFRRSDTQI